MMECFLSLLGASEYQKEFAFREFQILASRGWAELQTKAQSPVHLAQPTAEEGEKGEEEGLQGNPELSI